MSKKQYIKQLTRENTLLDRSFRTIAYARSLSQLGKAKISKSPVVGFGGITSLYYDSVDYKKQQRIILSELGGDKITKFGPKVVQLLEWAYLWGKSQHRMNHTKASFVEYINNFLTYHAYARGAIVYGYWGEPVITNKLKNLLNKKVSPSKLDQIISFLSAPRKIDSTLLNLNHGQSSISRSVNNLEIRLSFNEQEKKLIEILSWFTFFYEYGERVASYLYDELLYHLKKIIKSEKTFHELEWYDPDALLAYLSGKRLSEQELSKRKICYILRIVNNKLQILSGRKAKSFYHKYLAEMLSLDTSEIKGTVASPGKVRGIAKIIITQADQRKMKDGDVLISTMTTPRLMTAVSKAVAIVTDEGGMTAHAAIVARELKIPCVVGTRIATKVLKDGDMVEVNANLGVVKILKKK